MQQKKSKQKFKPLSSATPEEKREAFRMGALYTSAEVEGLTEFGAFSEQNLGIPAVEYFPLKAYQTLKDPNCKWKWKEGTKLSTLLINIIRSDMVHTLRDYRLDGEPLTKANSEFERDDTDEDGFDDANDPVDIDPEDRQNGFQVKSEMELLEELQQRESRRNRGYKIAKAAAKGDPQLEKYVEVVFGGASTDREVSKKLKKTLAELQELQDRLIERIKETI
jgi:hypothetical protein